jgi:acetolactate synthase I/II/III large subunit
MTLNVRNGGRILVDGLVQQAVEHVFCVPGESYLAVLDALYDTAIAVTVCRQEAGAAMMADAGARLSGRPGIVFVTRGPGATNAAHGVHIAEHDSVPLILFVGQIDRSMRGRGAFQEMDYRAFFGSITKWATEIDDVRRIPEILARAFRVAQQGRPGPVVIGLPEDMLLEMAAVEDAPAVEPVQTWPGLNQLAELQKLLWSASRPLVILGGSGWSPTACAGLQRFAERFALPVATSFRRSGLFDARSPHYAGEVGIGANPKLIERIKTADFILLCGGRMAEIPAQSYTLFDIPVPKPIFVHVHAGAEELGRVYQPTLAIHASPIAFAAALEGVQPPHQIGWSAHSKQAHADYTAWTQSAPEAPGAVNLAAIVIWLREHMPADTIYTNGAGNYAIWPGRFLRYRGYGTQLAPTSGSMGYGLPAAVGAKRLYPDRPVVCFAGDGCFLMNGQEFATAIQYALPIIVIVIDNGMYGTIRMHQEREFPGRVSATDLHNPDFAALARAFGGHGETVTRTAEFAPAFERARQSNRAAIIHVIIDPEAITPSTTLSAIRHKALAKSGAKVAG